MRELGSAPVPEPGPDDHVRGPAGGPVLVQYADFECPFCATLSVCLGESGTRRVFRHFPVRSSHPRAWAAACAAEAAALQGAFWPMHDAMFADQSRLEDPHLWQHARELELDLAQFDAQRRSDTVKARVSRDFESGLRAGVVTTPTLFVGGEMHAGRLAAATLKRLAESAA
ncbi:MAG: DsbA family protein [Solirubrobacteraceae bacterium]